MNLDQKISLILFIIISGNLSAQKENMKQEVVKKIELDSFSNRKGLDMGLAILNLAKERNQNVAVKIERLNHTIFLFVDDNLPADKHLWLTRKANVAKHFEEMFSKRKK